MVRFTDQDEGKRVLTSNGDTVGMVSEVRHGTAYVDPDPGMTDKIKSKLGWGDVDQDDYPLQEEAVASKDDDAIRLRAGM